MSVVTRGTCLLKAHKVINNERQDTYGAPEESFTVMADLMNVWFKKSENPYTAADAMAILLLLKMSRIINGTLDDDNYVDLCGYAALLHDEMNRNVAQKQINESNLGRLQSMELELEAQLEKIKSEIQMCIED